MGKQIHKIIFELRITLALGASIEVRPFGDLDYIFDGFGSTRAAQSSPARWLWCTQ
jgi:hypothetical protein